MSEKKDTPKTIPIADTDPRKAQLDQVAALLKANAMPGKLEETDASFESLAVHMHAVTYRCFLCAQDILEFAVWRVLCDHCDLEIIRCRRCDADGSLAKQCYLSHCEEVHPDLFVECACGLVTMHMHTMICPECGTEITRCRERCDVVAVLEEHRQKHGKGAA